MDTTSVDGVDGVGGGGSVGIGIDNPAVSRGSVGSPFDVGMNESLSLDLPWVQHPSTHLTYPPLNTDPEEIKKLLSGSAGLR